MGGQDDEGEGLGGEDDVPWLELSHVGCGCLAANGLLWSANTQVQIVLL